MKSVVVFGASGFVGQNVVKQLLNHISKSQLNCTVIGINRSGRPLHNSILSEQEAEKVEWVSAAAEDIGSWSRHVNSNTEAVVSCVGALGFDQQELERVNGDVNVGIFSQAAESKVPRVVYVSAAHDTMSEPIFHFLPGYFKGKKKSERCLRSHFPLSGTEHVDSGQKQSAGVILRPGFIYGNKPVVSAEGKVRMVPLGYFGVPMAAVFSRWPFTKLQNIPRMKQVFCPPVHVAEVGNVAAFYSLVRQLPDLESTRISNPEENDCSGLAVLDTMDISALSRSVCESL